MKGEYLISPFAAWLAAQVLKTLIYAIKNRKFEISRMAGDGGMPSCHSAFVTAIAVTALLCFGFFSFEFALSTVLAVVVMHDAAGVRLESGKQAKAINDLHESLQAFLNLPRNERLEEFLGHTPFQVHIGALLGAAVAVVVHMIMG